MLFFVHPAPTAGRRHAPASDQQEVWPISKMKEGVPDKSREPRVNERIRIPQVRVVGEDGEQIGVLSTRDALEMARGSGLDLVEVAPLAKPPVCRIMDYGKFKYEQSKKERRARQAQHVVNVKEVKLRPRIDDHDYQVKLANARRFLEAKDKVKVTIQFRGREMARQEFGMKLIDRLLADLEDIGQVENPPRHEGRFITMVMAPKRK
jgi:translation initiation factor IF-3